MNVVSLLTLLIGIAIASLSYSMASGGSAVTSWHDGSALNEAAKKFHDVYARQPADSTDKARTVHHKNLEAIKTFLKDKNVCVRTEYMGSTYEGVKVPKKPGDDDVEFDVLIVMADVTKLEATDAETPGYAKLKVQPRFEHDLKWFLTASGSENYIDAGNVYRKFLGLVQQWINENAERKDKMTLRQHGPAVQLDVYEDSGKSKKIYSVDLVPSLQVREQYFVAKPFKNKQGPSYCWRKTFNIREKDKLQTADTGNGCRKQVLRILKVIRNREPGLHHLSSYHLKTALFREMDKPTEWTHQDLGRRLMGVIGQLNSALTERSMPHYSIAGLNLIDDIPATSVNNMRDRLRRLLTSEHQMMSILSVDDGKKPQLELGLSGLSLNEL